MEDLTPERIRHLIDSAASVVGQVELEAMLQSIVDTAMELTGAPFGALGVLGDHGQVREFVYGGIEKADGDAIGHPPRGAGILGLLTRAGKTVRLDEIGAHPESSGFPPGHPRMHSFLGVPVRLGDRVFGNLYLTDKEGGFTDQDEILIELLAVTAGAAVSTLRLQDRLRRTALNEDRERIARDLHDSIIQDLFAVGLSLQGAATQIESDPSEVTDRIEDAVDQLDLSISSLRRYIFDLRPPVWARPSLSRHLGDLVDELTRPHGTDTALHVDCPPGVPAPHVVPHLTAVIKEAVSNAMRHASATKVEIDVTCNGNRVTAVVRDDGRGFDPRSITGGMGLANMKDRTFTAGGDLNIGSSPGEGTVIRATFPSV